MKVTWNWLAEFVEMELPLTALADRLAMSGFEVESVEPRGRELADIRCAEIVEVKPHPHAERLTVCEVRCGSEGSATVVCGAPNVRAGERVAYAPPGATLPGGRRIEAAEIRGIGSMGMLCAEAEMELGPDASGILALPGDAPLGERISSILRLEDTVLDIAVTPNRGDCVSVLGLAREIAALTGQPLLRQRVVVRESADSVAELISIRILDDDLCARYVARLISGVTVQPSPLWVQYRLRAVGVRPINNIVDVTNYVMIERGQPLHAFDYDRLPRPEIVVRRAGNDAHITTLDGKIRDLHPGDLLITSGDEPVAVAGVMGGGSSEVYEGTQRVLLESAWFAPSAIRHSSRRLGLRTEASYRFERHVDVEGVPVAADRAAALMVRLAGGSVARGRVDAYPSVRTSVPISLRLKRVDELLGMTIGRAEITTKLKALGMTTSQGTRGTITVVPPSYRADLTREIDIIEEIVRLVGYENVPTTLPASTMMAGAEGAQWRHEAGLRRFLAARGLTEAVLLSFCSARLNALFHGWRHPQAAVCIRNPLTQDDSQLRLSLSAGLIKMVRTNRDQGLPSVAAFSIGKVFWHAETFREARRVAGVVCPTLPRYGLGRDLPPAEFSDIKGIVEAILGYFGVADATWAPAADLSAWHPGKTARISVACDAIGVAGALHPTLAETLGVDDPCWLFELDLDAVLQYAPSRIIFRDLPRYPAVVRDLAVVADISFASDRVASFVRAWEPGAEWIKDVRLFDRYVGSPIPDGKQSLAYSIGYRAADRTLTDTEVNDLHAGLVAALEESLPVELR